MAPTVKSKLRIDELLIKKNMTQKDLSEQTGIRANTISDIVRGARTVINFKHLELIATVLDVQDINDILTFEKIENK
ncbi:helix-turn-helix transcriptional regulator [Marinilactibacillus sp. Marseille-P9653]|uniref:helix-turn-helix domain-containing protein n=1 Tax=Marinilactibacillus sp. Marseille-P9653 TaxID=2866583 RepID=UPI001CE3F796|nr:helix-turn-helix transcriptional regulator [Marinilactibacillus sp. Marseille-P9653]